MQDLKRHGVLQRAGSVRWCWTITDTGEETAAIRINVVPMTSLRLNYTANGADVEQFIQLDHPHCNYGGTRPWLLCPHCTRRVGVLYLRSSRFVCRQCGQVAYASCYVRRSPRAESR